MGREELYPYDISAHKRICKLSTESNRIALDNTETGNKKNRQTTALQRMCESGPYSTLV